MGDGGPGIAPSREPERSEGGQLMGAGLGFVSMDGRGPDAADALAVRGGARVRSVAGPGAAASLGSFGGIRPGVLGSFLLPADIVRSFAAAEPARVRTCSGIPRRLARPRRVRGGVAAWVRSARLAGGLACRRHGPRLGFGRARGNSFVHFARSISVGDRRQWLKRIAPRRAWWPRLVLCNMTCRWSASHGTGVSTAFALAASAGRGKLHPGDSVYLIFKGIST